MSDLTDAPRAALGGASATGLVTVQELPPQGMITLRGDLSDPQIAKCLSEVAGVAMPGARGAQVQGEAGLLWMSPDEAMLLCPHDAVAEKLAALQAGLEGLHVLVADVSDARAVFRCEGAAVREVLAKLSPADLRPQMFPVGELRRTRLAQVSGAFWLDDEQKATVVCFRSVAGYVFGLLAHSAKPDSAVGLF